MLAHVIGADSQGDVTSTFEQGTTSTGSLGPSSFRAFSSTCASIQSINAGIAVNMF